APVAITVAASRMTPSGGAVRGALQATIAALGPGGGTVRLPAGRFAVSDLKIGGGVRLIGAGAGRTVLVASTTPDEDAVEVTGHDVLISDLSIDDGGTGSTPDGSAVIFVHDAEDVVLRRLSLVHLRGYGVEVLGHHERISVQQSTIDGDGRGLIGVAEWSEDASSSDVSVVRCVIRNLSKYGVLLQSFFNGHTWPHRRALAYGNDISQIHDSAIHDGTIEIGIWLAGANGAALDNLVRDTGWDGIETVVNATSPTVAGNVIRDTRTGIYVENVTRDALIEQNDIAGVSVAGINLEPPHGGPQSGHLTIRQNRVVGAGIYGIGTGPGTLGSRITGNQVLDSGKMAILLDGASGNVVEGNDLRDRRKPARQAWCVYDPQTRGSTTRNSVQNNDCSGSLNGGSTDPAEFSARRGATP
ncbi:MAG: right-handed parallel beta-helix repeat-containing protein, partial [Gaiellales bacterium]